MKDGVAFPPVRAWFDGTEHWLADGFHRINAAMIAGQAEISAYIFKGALSAAIWDSYGANSRHGLPRKQSEIVTIINRALQHPNSAQLSNVELARHLGIPEATLRRWRKRLSSSSGDDGFRVVNRNGTTYRLRVGGIGKGASVLASRSQKNINALRRDLHAMQAEASASAQRILCSVEAWIFQGGSALECLKNVEAILAQQCDLVSRGR
jgi:transposase-like protein